MRLSLTKEDLATPAGEALLQVSVRVTEDGKVSQGDLQELLSWRRKHGDARLPAARFIIPIIDRAASTPLTGTTATEIHRAIEKIMPPSERRLAAAARAGVSSAARSEAREERDANRPITKLRFMVAGARDQSSQRAIEKAGQVGARVRLQLVTRGGHATVAVLGSGGEPMGTVPADDAMALAPLLSAGHPYVADIVEHYGYNEPTPLVAAAIYPLPPAIAPPTTTPVGPAPPPPRAGRGGRRHRPLVALSAFMLMLASTLISVLCFVLALAEAKLRTPGLILGCLSLVAAGVLGHIYGRTRFTQ